MENKIVEKLKNFIRKIDRAAGIQLVMISLTLVAFIILLYIQQYLPSFEGSQSKIIIVDVLLGVGLLIEFGYFFWHTNKYGNVEDTEKTKDAVKPEEPKEPEKDIITEDGVESEEKK